MAKLLIRTSMTLACLWLAAIVFGQDTKLGASPPWAAGDANAAVSIEVFNDYQCPACATFNERLKTIQAKRKDKVRVIFRNYPLTRTHENSLLAAQTAEASGFQGKFFEMINQLYATQREWAESGNVKDLFISYAKLLKLDLDKFVADLNCDAVRRRIQLDIERANSLGIGGTPSVLINGKLVPLEATYDDIEKQIDAALVAAQRNLSE